jgi:hypothetical protein
MHWCPDEHRNLCSNYTSSKEGNAECTMTKTFVHINIYCNLKNWALIEVGDIVVLRITNVKIREGIGKGLRSRTRVEKYIRAGEMTAILPSNPDTIFRLLFQKVNFGSHVRNIASGTILSLLKSEKSGRITKSRLVCEGLWWWTLDAVRDKARGDLLDWEMHYAWHRGFY